MQRNHLNRFKDEIETCPTLHGGTEVLGRKELQSLLSMNTIRPMLNLSFTFTIVVKK